MTSFSEGNINRDSDGKFAAKTTAETDASALGDVGEEFVGDRIENRETKIKVPGFERPVYASGTWQHPYVETSARISVPNDIDSEAVRDYAYQWTDVTINADARKVTFGASVDANATVSDAATALRQGGYDDIERMKRDGSLAADMRAFAAERNNARETFARLSGNDRPVALMNQYMPFHASARADADPERFYAGLNGGEGDTSDASYAAGQRERQFQESLHAPYPADDPWSTPPF